MEKTLLITGGTSPIGREIIRKFAKAGFNVFFTYYQNLSQAEIIATEVSAFDKKCFYMQSDLSHHLAVEEIFDEFKKHYKKIDALVNNAVITPVRIPLTSMNDNDIEKQIVAGLTSVIKICKHAAIDYMQKGSSIINISSEAAKFGGNQISVYAAVKGGINSFTTGFAREAAKLGIRVNAISPGVIATTEETEEDSFIPLGRKGLPSEVAELAKFLSSTHAEYITGSIYPINGGR